MSRSIWVYAHWGIQQEPAHVGKLEVDLVRGAEVYRFAYTSKLSIPDQLEHRFRNTRTGVHIRPYTLSEKERPRLSLAGAQDKCPVLLKNSKFWLPKKESPSSHILKFELSDYRHLPAYETFTALLARAIGLPVVDAQ